MRCICLPVIKALLGGVQWFCGCNMYINVLVSLASRPVSISYLWIVFMNRKKKWEKQRERERERCMPNFDDGLMGGET